MTHIVSFSLGLAEVAEPPHIVVWTCKQPRLAQTHSPPGTDESNMIWIRLTEKVREYLLQILESAYSWIFTERAAHGMVDCMAPAETKRAVRSSFSTFPWSRQA